MHIVIHYYYVMDNIGKTQSNKHNINVIQKTHTMISERERLKVDTVNVLPKNLNFLLIQIW